MKTIFALLSTCGLMAYPTFGQCQTHKLLASDGGWNDYFGTSVAISGTAAIVGAYGHSDAGNNSGAAFLFDTTTGLQTFELEPDVTPANDRFGFAVGIDGPIAIVGAWRGQGADAITGAAYFFDTATGAKTGRVFASDGAPQDWFGRSVAVSGTIAIVGAPQDDDLGDRSGSAYLFDATTGVQIAKLLPNDGAAGDEFGRTVAISGGIAIVGSHRNSGSAPFSGSAYLFDVTTGQQVAKLVPADGVQDDAFGVSVAVDGATAIVGAYFDDDLGFNSGSAYLFDTTTGMQIAKLLPNDGTTEDRFGIAVGISGSFAVVGSWGDDYGHNSGSAYIFAASTGAQVGKLLRNAGSSGDFFGSGVSISNTTVCVGAPWDEDLGNFAGSSYLFSLEFQGTNYCASVPNSTGQPATISACGSLSLAANSFGLAAQPVPNQFYQFIHSPNQTQAPFGNGFLCLSGGFTRLGPLRSAAGGVATITVDLPSAGITTAGTYQFQCWYRDSAAAGSAFNTTDGLSVTFVP